MIYCLDTNVIIAIMRGQERTIERLTRLSPDLIKIPEIVRAELVLGCLKSNHPDRELAKVDHVIDVFEWLPFAGDCVEHYASIRATLETEGNLIGPNDLLIAATARAAGAIMVTSNLNEFSRVSGLVVESWS